LAEPCTDDVPEPDPVEAGGIEVVALPQAAAGIPKQATARQQTNLAPKRLEVVTLAQGF
jgi:hypothetical protein